MTPYTPSLFEATTSAASAAPQAAKRSRRRADVDAAARRTPHRAATAALRAVTAPALAIVPAELPTSARSAKTASPASARVESDNRALPIDSKHLLTTEDSAEVGFAIGWDYARYRLVPPSEHLAAANPVRQGWQSGTAAFGARTTAPSRAVRLWLQLRLQSWLAARPFEDFAVTARFAARIDVDVCPVSRRPLREGASVHPLAGAEPTPIDALADEPVLMVLNLGAATAAGNVAVVARSVAQARGAMGAQEIRNLAERMQREDMPPQRGLDAAAWQRLATLVSLTTPVDHAQLATRPLAVLPPNRVRLLNPVQALATLLTGLLATPGYARRMTDLGTLMPTMAARRAFQMFMSTMLARRLATGWSADPVVLRHALEDAWSHPVVARRWEQLAWHLSAAGCERIVRLAAQRGLAPRAMRWMDDAKAVDGWGLSAEPQATAHPPVAAPSPAAERRASVNSRREAVATARKPQGDASSAPCALAA